MQFSLLMNPWINEISVDGPKKRQKLEECPHKERCYRKNPHHFKQFEHPFLNNLIEMGDLVTIPENMPQTKENYLEQLEILRPILQARKSSEAPETKTTTSTQNRKEPKPQATSCSGSSGKICGKTAVDNTQCSVGSMLDKLQKNAPYNLFFTTIPKSQHTLSAPNSVTFTDLLCPSLGPLKESLQINFMIDIGWLVKQYKAREQELELSKPLTILYGDDWPDMVEYMRRFCPNVKHHFVKMKDPFGCHHTKLGIYAYEDESIRVVVSTANLYYEDWNHYNQGLWISPRLAKLPSNSAERDGEAITGFKGHLLDYLRSYQLPILRDWVKYVANADFGEVKVALVYSAPGKHYAKQNGSHLHRVGDLLSQHCVLPAKTTAQSEGPLSWGILAQASSIGSIGKTAAEWLRGSLLRSLASHKQSPLPGNSQATISLVYPSVSNVAHGYFGLESGGCLPYSKATNEKQRWLQTYMHQWIADARHRTRAMPHIKSYCRVSPGLDKLAYFLLTSANLSKSAWGNNIQKDGGCYIRSYEMGVMFLPRFFDEEFFEISNPTTTKALFPFIYDLPLTPYKKDDYPWCN
uniref:PBZ-type domain-containing protein n=1 Tax=Dendroctonus ponderosae TaxID=77166 RepID=A0AAR5QH68_DENPD